MVADYANNRTVIGKVVSAHTNHPYAPERMMGLSRCTQCHMAKTQGPTRPSRCMDTRSRRSRRRRRSSTRTRADAELLRAVVPRHAGSTRRWWARRPRGSLRTSSTWDKQYDRDLANALMNYYGPNGVWWQLDISTVGRAPRRLPSRHAPTTAATSHEAVAASTTGSRRERDEAAGRHA